MGSLPVPGDIFIGLGQRWVDVDGTQDLVESKTVAHGSHKLGNQFAGVLPGDGDAEDAVLAGHREHLHHAMCCFIRNGAVQIVDRICRDFVGDVFLPGFMFVPPTLPVPDGSGEDE